MSSFVRVINTIRRKFPGNVVVNRINGSPSQLRKDQCSVLLEGAPEPYVALDCDGRGLPFEEEVKRCDYLFIAGKNSIGLVVPLELISGRNKTWEYAAAQLQAGLDMTDHLLSSLGASAEVCAVLVGKVKPARRRTIRRAPQGGQQNQGSVVSFRGKRYQVRRIECGDPLTKAL